uniref:Uncharacterized protein n=1 Tax=Panagrolaimus davidi TaxID=227884 RepID=A0A914PRH9_9BILA
MVAVQVLEAASLSAAADKNATAKALVPKSHIIPATNDFPLKNDPSIISDAEIAEAKSKCGGGCTSSSQCSNYDGGNTDCRCSWFSCKLYNKMTGKKIQ